MPTPTTDLLDDLRQLRTELRDLAEYLRDLGRLLPAAPTEGE
ncbi:hypothetical protein ACFP2T_13575 [Plantactinospora solaniradicis]|uniref:Uncharacterized protein n=1 Tax=Plantactinospora solaniradicis TaxID=1723736 RepID=A0ABW1K888_9ACTN